MQLILFVFVFLLLSSVQLTVSMFTAAACCSSLLYLPGVFFVIFVSFDSVRSNEIPAEVVNLLVFMEDFIMYSQLPRKVD